MVQGSQVIAVADEMKEIEGTDSDAGIVIRVKVKETTARTTQGGQIVRSSKIVSTKTHLMRSKRCSLSGKTSFAKDEDGNLSDDLDTFLNKC